MEKFALSFLNALDRLDERIGHSHAIALWGKRIVNGLLIALLAWVLWRAFAF